MVKLNQKNPKANEDFSSLRNPNKEVEEIFITGPHGTTTLCRVEKDGEYRYVLRGSALDADGLFLLAQGIFDLFRDCRGFDEAYEEYEDEAY